MIDKKKKDKKKTPSVLRHGLQWKSSIFYATYSLFLICCIFSKVKRKVEKYSQDTQTIMKLMRQAGRAIKYLNKSFTGQDKVTNFPSLFEQPQ